MAFTGPPTGWRERLPSKPIRGSEKQPVEDTQSAKSEDPRPIFNTIGDPDTRDEIIGWPSPIDFHSQHAPISANQQEGTGGQLLEDPKYKDWESGSDGQTEYFNPFIQAAELSIPEDNTPKVSPAAIKDISTFVICWPESSAMESNPPYRPAVLPEDAQIAETNFSTGGSFFSAHSSEDAVLWVEEHYDNPLLRAIQTHGTGGPIAAMLSPELPALVLFGSILDGWIMKAAKLLANISNFAVMIRPHTNNPLNQWLSLVDEEHNVDKSGSKQRRPSEDSNATAATAATANTDILATETPPQNLQQVLDEGAAADIYPHRNYRPLSRLSEEAKSMTGSESEDSVERGSLPTDSDDDMSVDSGVFRLRGGADEEDDIYIPWMSPVHNLDIHLDLRTPNMACEVGLFTKIQFKVQDKYENKEREGYRPQAVSWTRFMVSPANMNVVPDRSYSSVGFLVHRRYISLCDEMPCDGFIEPSQTIKTVKTKTLGISATAAAALGPHPTGGPSLTVNRTTSDATESQNDRVTPKWQVKYSPGGRWSSGDNSYDGKNVVYLATDNERKENPLDVQFSMGINFGDHENPSNNDVPAISFIIRNQTMLWVHDKSLKAKGQGMIVLTSSYIPEIQTIDELYVVEGQRVELANGLLNNISGTDKARPRYPANLSLSLGVVPPKEKLGFFKRISNKLAVKSLTLRNSEPTDPGITKLSLHEVIARGWDAATEQWIMPVYPALDRALDPADNHMSQVWDVDIADLQADNQPKRKGKQRDPGPPTIEEPDAGEEQEIVNDLETIPNAIPFTTGHLTPSTIDFGNTTESSESHFPMAGSRTGSTSSDTHALSGAYPGSSDLNKLTKLEPNRRPPISRAASQHHK
ncbi:hypothetical protein B0H11DRAFT_2279622 [Mycena galericulata]|nr:hypothetical protein B0H11DRAFT_2279622 [Mycena galericulata]